MLFGTSLPLDASAAATVMGFGALAEMDLEEPAAVEETTVLLVELNLADVTFEAT